MLNGVEYARYVVRLNPESDSELCQRAPIDTLIRLPSDALEHLKEFVFRGTLLQRHVMEPKHDESGQNALNAEKPVFDLLKLVEHSQDNFLLQVKHVLHLLGI